MFAQLFSPRPEGGWKVWIIINYTVLVLAQPALHPIDVTLVEGVSELCLQCFEARCVERSLRRVYDNAFVDSPSLSLVPVSEPTSADK